MAGTVMRVEKEKASADTAVRGANPTARRENRTGIPTQLKERMEQSTGLSLDDVRVHYHSPLPAKLNALAYTIGNRVEIAPGQERHLSHELGHVVQQKLGMVRANATHSSGVALNTEVRLERQADEIGAGKKMSGSVLEQSPVVQMYIKSVEAEDNFSYNDPHDNAILEDSPKPVMVFESMGTSLKDCDEIYKQTCNYDGDTICIFGLNKKVNDKLDSDRNKGELLELQTGIAGSNIKQGIQEKEKHLLYVFAFIWNPLNKDKSGGYEMPFVEARFLIMNMANHLINKKKYINTQKEPCKFLYRWIDADARNDTSKDVSAETLNKLSDNTIPQILTGRYDWRHEIDEIPTVDKDSEIDSVKEIELYDLFLIKMNEAEKELRTYFHELSTYIGPSPKNDYLPGYYLPETVFVMNQAAHDSICMGLYSQLNGGSKSERMMPQDKESMRALSCLSADVVSPDMILYDSALSASKPIKYELEDREEILYETGKDKQDKLVEKKARKSYWGSNMLEFLSNKKKEKKDSQTSKQDIELETSEKEITSEEHSFISALKNLRQSAFQKWYFISGSDWDSWENWRFKSINSKTYKKGTLESMQRLLNMKKCSLEMKLWKFLNLKSNEKTVLQLIRSFLKNKVSRENIRTNITPQIRKPQTGKPQGGKNGKKK